MAGVTVAGAIAGNSFLRTTERLRRRGRFFHSPIAIKFHWTVRKLTIAQDQSQNCFNDLWANFGDVGTPAMIVNLESG
jgi:hypothetical protein